MPTARFRIGRDDFAIDFSDFARHGRGVPLFKLYRESRLTTRTRSAAIDSAASTISGGNSILKTV